MPAVQGTDTESPTSTHTSLGALAGERGREREDRCGQTGASSEAAQGTERSCTAPGANVNLTLSTNHEAVLITPADRPSALPGPLSPEELTNKGSRTGSGLWHSGPDIVGRFRDCSVWPIQCASRHTHTSAGCRGREASHLTIQPPGWCTSALCVSYIRAGRETPRYWNCQEKPAVGLHSRTPYRTAVAVVKL